MTPSEILTAAAALITEGTWCRGFQAYDADGEGVYANDPKAVKWCLVGACCKIGGFGIWRDLPKPLWNYITDGIHTVDEECGNVFIGRWNDEQFSFKSVRAALLAAAEYAKQDEGQ